MKNSATTPGAAKTGSPLILWEEKGDGLRATLEEEPEGGLLLTVSGSSPDEADTAFLLDPEETAQFRTWGADYAARLVREVRGAPLEYAGRNLLPPFAPSEGEEEGEGEGEEPIAAGTRRFGTAVAVALALVLVVGGAWLLDRPTVVGEERQGVAVFLHAAPAEVASQGTLVVTLYGGEQVSVPVPGDHVLRAGGRVVLREYRSPLFGKRAWRFVRYV
jgi:hypothetical protein